MFTFEMRFGYIRKMQRELSAFLYHFCIFLRVDGTTSTGGMTAVPEKEVHIFACFWNLELCDPFGFPFTRI